MAHPSASASLRDEFPALALTLGFAAPKDREHWADLLLLWGEINRARNAAESMIAAARITWWREALDHNKPEGVPLAERILAAGRDITPITAMLNTVVNITLQSGPDGDHAVAHAMGDMLSTVIGAGDGADYAHTLLALRSAQSGHGINTDTAATLLTSTLPTPFKLMVWLAETPDRLHYPDQHPLLPLKMMWRAIRL